MKQSDKELLTAVQERLSGGQPNTTARYSHLFDDPLRQATERVGAVVAAAGNGETAEIANLRGDGTA